MARGSIQIIGGLGAGLLVAVLLAAWRLASGPVSISFLTPYIDQALNEVHQGAFVVTFDDTILTWAGWQRTLDIRMVNLRTQLPTGELVASIPEVSISLSAKALLHGTVAPRSVEFFGPSLNVVRQADGQFAMGFAGASDGSQDFVASLLLVMLQEPDPTRAMSYLKRISVVAGEVTFEDNELGTVWHAPSADAAFSRTPTGLKAELDLDLQAGDKMAEVTVEGNYTPENKRIDLGLSFEDVTPSTFAVLSEKVAILGALDLPMSGTVTLSLEQDGRIDGVGFDLTGDQGHLALPVPLAGRLGMLDWAQRVGISAMEISGRYDGLEEVLDISQLTLDVAPGETIYIPAPLDHDMPMARIDAALRYGIGNGELDVSRLNLDVGGPRAEITATLSNVKATQTDPALPPSPDDGLFVDLTATAFDVPFDDLGKLWPKNIGIDARTWVMDGLSKGIADRATVNVSMRPDGAGGLRLDAVAGDMQAHGLDVQYLSTMPKVTNAKGSATFDANRFDIKVESGESAGGLKVTGGEVSLVELQEDLQWAEIKLDIEGPVPAALRLVDSKPLLFASALGIEADTSEGHAVANVSLRIPLRYDLDANQVEAVASAQLSQAGLKGALFERDLSDGNLALSVTNQGLDLKGEARLGNIPVQIAWTHDFRPNALFLDRYELSGYIEDVLNLNALGVEVPGILSRYLEGGVQANVSTTAFSDGGQALSARIDLANIQLSIPELGWSKPSGVPAAGVIEMRIDNDLLREIPKFSISAPDMDVSGSAVFSPDGKLERIDLDTMRSGLTDVTGSLTPLDNNFWELVLRGESLDARNLWDEFVGIGGQATIGAPKPAVSPAPKAAPVTPVETVGSAPEDAGTADTAIETAEPDEDLQQDTFLDINVAVDLRTVIMHQNRMISDLIGTLYRRDDLWNKMDVVGTVANSAPIRLLMDSDQQGLRYLSISSSNAGSALRRLDLYDNMNGGVLDLKAAYTRPGKDAPLEGVVKINDFAMINAPMFTKLIGIMSLTGVLDALKGDGLNFDVLEAPFKLQGGVVELSQARASGPSLGVTTSGRVDMDKHLVDLKGTVVPAYAINALLGKIPLIGELFTGSEKGGGLFAATYTMKGEGENVDISVNPLSVLAPGALRDIFTGSGKEKDIPEVAPSPEPRSPVQPGAAPNP